MRFRSRKGQNSGFLAQNLSVIVTIVWKIKFFKSFGKLNFLNCLIVHFRVLYAFISENEADIAWVSRFFKTRLKWVISRLLTQKVAVTVSQIVRKTEIAWESRECRWLQCFRKLQFLIANFVPSKATIVIRTIVIMYFHLECVKLLPKSI